jgi:Amt family ammonium transporter
MPAAERHNMAADIDRWAVGQAVARLRQCVASGEEMPLLAVNLSGSSLNDRDFVDYVLAQVQDGETGRGLCFDIPEAALISGAQPVVSFMQAVRQHGCRVALDDFGTNLSSFHYLKQYPVDFLKIDGQLLGEFGSDPIDRCMIEAIAKVATTLGVATIAERVESALTFDHLRELGIDYAQGFHLG